MVDVTGSNNLYTSYLVETFRGGVFELENHAIKVGLTRASYVPLSSHTDLADITDELTGNGYSRQTLNNVVVSSDGVWVKASFDPIHFDATGGDLLGKYWFMFDDTVAGGPLIAWGQIDVGREGEVTLVDGHGLDIVVNELGLYRVPA